MKLSRSFSMLMGATALTLTMGLQASAQDTLKSDATATPIKHLVVIYQENVSFDHYFATYPHATNPIGEPAFHAKKNTPTDINTVENAGLLTNNPNLNPLNGAGAANPFRLDVTQAATADQNHSYTPEQQAEDNGAADCSRSTPVTAPPAAPARSARPARSWATMTATPSPRCGTTPSTSR